MAEKLVTVENLTEDEVQLLKNYRAEKRAKQEARDYQLFVLETAYEYLKWMHRTGEGMTYSTFCDGFGVGANPSKIGDRSSFYTQVIKVIAEAEPGQNRPQQ